MYSSVTAFRGHLTKKVRTPVTSSLNTNLVITPHTRKHDL